MPDQQISLDPEITDPLLIEDIPVISAGVNKRMNYINLASLLQVDIDQNASDIASIDPLAQWTESSGNVIRATGVAAIGTTSPFVSGGSGSLTLGGTTGGILAFQHNGSRGYEIYSDVANGYRIFDGAAFNTDFQIKAGSTGIGVSPNANTKLDVDGVIRSKSYTVATLPTVIETAVGIIVTDDTSGETPAWCDGSNWKRFDTNVNITA